jgi:hypothetical protein
LKQLVFFKAADAISKNWLEPKIKLSFKFSLSEALIHLVKLIALVTRHLSVGSIRDKITLIFFEENEPIFFTKKLLLCNFTASN